MCLLRDIDDPAHDPTSLGQNVPLILYSCMCALGLGFRSDLGLVLGLGSLGFQYARSFTVDMGASCRI